MWDAAAVVVSLRRNEFMTRAAVVRHPAPSGDAGGALPSASGRSAVGVPSVGSCCTTSFVFIFSLSNISCRRNILEHQVLPFNS